MRISERNATPSEDVSALTAEMRALDLERERIERLRERIEADFRDARSTLESGRRTARLGQVLLEQRESLPDLQTLRRNAEQRKDTIAETDARRLSHRPCFRAGVSKLLLRNLPMRRAISGAGRGA